MNIKLIIQELLKKGYDPLDVIKVIASEFRLSCIRTLKEGVDQENDILSSIRFDDSIPHSKQFLETISKNEDAVVGIYLTDQLLKIIGQIRKEMKDYPNINPYWIAHDINVVTKPKPDGKEKPN